MSATRGSFVEIDHDAMCANAMALRDLVRPAELCAVVKAGGYGHGAVAAAHAAVRGGATWIAVATIPEGEELRRVGIEVPILVLAEPRAAGFAEAIAASLSVMVYSASGIDAAIDAARSADEPLRVHLKVDTGMARVGATPAQAVDAVRRLNESPVILEGVCTHLASADDPDQRSSRRQLELFEAFLGAAKSLLPDTVVIHAANTAGAIAFPEARYDLVRCGIGLYGIGPTPAMAAAAGLTPSLRLISEVAFVKDVPEGTPVSYGGASSTTAPTRLATIPIGYADGVRRDLGLRGGQVLIRGRRHPIMGVVTMDQLVVADSTHSVEVGDEVVLIGAQGTQSISVDEVANALDTITYEIATSLGPRLPRRRGSGSALRDLRS